MFNVTPEFGLDTRRGRSRARHVRDRDTDIERGKSGGGAFTTLERRGLQGRDDIWVVFSCKGAQRGERRGPKGRADALAIIVS